MSRRKKEVNLHQISEEELKVIDCREKRQVKSCEECIRKEFCYGLVNVPYAQKLIDLWMDYK